MRIRNDPAFRMVSLVAILGVIATASHRYIADFDRILEERKEEKMKDKAKTALKMLGTLLAYVLILAFVCWLVTIIIPLPANAADLKCVTIKFKSDSELKLKTQWFVNHCDTTGWYVYNNSPVLTCRTLLFPPEIRKEPVINLAKTDSTQTTVTPRWKISCEDGDTIWHVPCGDSAIMGYLYTMGPYYRSDTTEGEALLWYEER